MHIGGCPIDEHENYGEDGMNCPVEGHECVPTSKAVLSMLGDLRREIVARDAGLRSEIALKNATIKGHEAAMREVHGMMKHQRELNAEQMHETIEPSPEEEILRASLEKL